MENTTPKIVLFQPTYNSPYPLEVKGESHYKENIKSICGRYGRDGYHSDDHAAFLILEDDNPEDNNAVRIEIEDRKVGYLSRENAKIYRQKLTGLNLTNIIGACPASIGGGFKKRDGSEADFGIRLDLDMDNFREAEKPIQQISKSQKPVIPASVKPYKKKRLSRIPILIGALILFFGLIGFSGTFKQTNAIDIISWIVITGVFILAGAALIFVPLFKYFKKP